ncbi:MAG: DNA double-strand break repair nuclease NurA [Desulfurococcales archaeon]|nr:DNA double-strand break repair nuclease NurA [Desulfurococcales archaeon]
MSERVTAVLRRLAELLGSTGRTTGIGRSVLRLQDLLEARLSIEDAGMALAEVLEGQARLLMPLEAGRAHRVREPSFTLAGLDSSSRHLETPPADIVVGTVSATFWRGLGFDWPSLGGGRLWLRGLPYIYILPNDPDLAGRLEVNFATTVNPAGRPFDPDYSVHQALDEMRVSLENWALKTLAGEDLRPHALLLDGPVFLVARAVFDQVAVKYRDSWRALLQDRLDSVRLLEDKGVAVVGVVKRVERSRLLSVAAGIEALLSRCGLRVGAIGDRALIDAALRLGCFKWRPGSILRSPKLRVRLGEGLEKIVEYVVVPLGGFNLSPATARVYRLEYTQRTLSILKSRGLEPVHVFLADSVARDSLEPVTIASSDRRSSSITRALRRMLASTLRAWGVPISYSSMVEVAEDWREALAGS